MGYVGPVVGRHSFVCNETNMKTILEGVCVHDTHRRRIPPVCVNEVPAQITPINPSCIP